MASSGGLGRAKAVVHLFGGPYLTVDGRRSEVPEEASDCWLSFPSIAAGRTADLWQVRCGPTETIIAPAET